MPEQPTTAACGHTDHRVNDRGERQGQIERTAWEPCAAAQEFREGDCIVMSQYEGPGAIWFRISRGWINGYGSEVPADWPTNPGAVLIARDGKPVTDGE